MPHGKNPFVRNIAWSYDASYIYFEHQPELYSSSSHIYSVRLDGTRLKKLSEGFSAASAPSVARDGIHVYFVAVTSDPADKSKRVSGIAMKNLATGENRYLIRGRSVSPKIAPSGTQMIYNQITPGGSNSLWFMDLHSGEAIDLTPGRAVSTGGAFWLE